MLLGIICVVIVVGLTYVHWLQGCFTSLISAICAFMGVLVAFGYYETLAAMLGGGAFGDYAPGMMLMALYATVYLLLRILFDSLIPGNLKLQLYVEKAGSVVFGLIAALLCAGVFAIAAQMMPLGAAAGGFARYPMTDKQDLSITAADFGEGIQQNQGVPIFDQVVPAELNPVDANSLPILPVDGFVVSIVSACSGGAFAGDAGFADVHPAFTDELFGMRVGPEGSSKRIFLNTPAKSWVKVTHVINSGSLIPVDPELTNLRDNTSRYIAKIKNTPVTIRVAFSDAAGDSDGYVRVTPAAVRVVIDGTAYNPIGNVIRPGMMASRRIDDLMAVPMRGTNNAINFVFDLPKEAATRVLSPKTTFAGVDPFIQVRGLGRASLLERDKPKDPSPYRDADVLQKKASPAVRAVADSKS